MEVILYLCLGTLYLVKGQSDPSNDDTILSQNVDNYPDYINSDENRDLIEEGIKNYAAEKKLGEPTLLGPNQHRFYPLVHPDLVRRFVLQYPYKEKNRIDANEQAEVYLHEAVKKFQEETLENNRLKPVKASPELVLAVSTRAAVKQALEPNNDLEERSIEKDILRTGNYWNNVWREDVDPNILRSQNDNDIQSVKVKIMPGTKLYQLVGALKKISPRLIYVTNTELNN